MINKIFWFSWFILACDKISAQDMSKFRLYNPPEQAEKRIGILTREAKAEGKHVLIQVGNNGCVWCARFTDLVNKDSTIGSLLRDNYIMYHLNSSKENPNERILRKYRFPQRFGYPVFLILNGRGELIHTQNSVYLEQGLDYNKEKVREFLQQWTRSAMDPQQFKIQ
ncbi:MAG TPA: thioredoxin family protein [Chitinophagaceae bacterium]|nr:thioredoxin family protein [Chitinophagaceae bacterium]